jgi:hypothetical protein
MGIEMGCHNHTGAQRISTALESLEAQQHGE